MRPASALVSLVLLALVLLGAYLRTAPAVGWVFGEAQARFLDADSYYHLRHTRFCAANFPHLQRWDLATHYPHGQRAVTPGLFQITMAGVTLLAARGAADETTLHAVLAWTPVVLGCLALLLLFALVRLLADPINALVAVALVTLYSTGFLHRTLLGFADHHAAEVALVLAIVWGLASTLAASSDEAPGTGWRRAAVRALPVALLLFTWNGAPVYLVVIALALFLALVLEVAGGGAQGAPLRPMIRYGVALMVLVGVPPLFWRELVMDPSYFPLAVLLCLLLAAVPPVYLVLCDRLRRAGWPPWWIALGTLGAPVVIAALALWMVPGSRRFLKVMLEPKIAWVAEHMPVSLAQYWGNLGWPGILAFAAPAAVLAFRARGRDRLPALFASLAATLLLLEWIRVRDYEYLAPPLSAFAAAVVLHAAFGRSPGLDVARRRAAAAGVAVVLAALPVWPLGLHPSPFLTEPVLRSLIILTDGWGQAMGWMAAHTPEPTLPVDVRVAAFDDFHYPAGTYGVLNAWDYGNFVSALGRRPTVVSQGVSRPAAEWLVAGSEADGLASWQSLMQPGESVRYAVIGAPTVSDHVASTFAFLGRSPSDLIERAGQGQMMRYGEQFTTTLMWRLYGEAGSGLARHRLVYQSPHRSLLFYRGRSAGPDGRPSLQLRSLPMDRADAVQLHAELVRRGVLHTVDGTMYAPVVLPTVRIFEIVAGARIAGRAAPGATVEVGLPLRSRSDGYEWVYVQLAVADGDGRFEVTVPYATEPAPISDVVALDRYRVRVTDARKHSSARFLEVSERAVQAGDRLDLGLLP